MALKAEGLLRTFGRDWATIERKEGATLKTYGVYLTPPEARLCDEVEDLESGLYEKIIIPVINTKGEVLTSWVYRMTDDQLKIEAQVQELHDCDWYLDDCIRTDMHYYEFAGLTKERETYRNEGWSIEVLRIGTRERIRTYTNKI